MIALCPLLCFSQEKIEGIVMVAIASNQHIGLPGANVYWMNSQTGTVTNEEGLFGIPYKKEFDRLIISYVGFESDILIINGPKTLHHFLQPSNELDEVVVEKKRDALRKSRFSPQNIITVNSAELLKAACCNLSKSFETNPAIDVNFNDALQARSRYRCWDSQVRIS